ncbi:LysR family transcriptional regulator [Aeromonas diversa CDC 2478-85]|uniref:LysR family transcriptional regulator n=1 Tax=Aeromonas diversa CDC 2478-85 TaxID=1268237 RepID=N9U2Q6_9GAMM|nr:LysR family transcriptional regulator [Aeromonas diversa]ENY72654.1 LysR family transcriptional regulator [Aeromonas diversa CDC 2478-85]
MNNQPLDLMGLFAVLVEQGSFTAAAEQLGMPKSSVSQKLARLEAHLGVRLLQRTTRRLHLTPQGEAYYQHCRVIRERASQAAREMSLLQETAIGRLRITAPEATGILLLGGWLAGFQQAYPGVSIELVLSDEQRDLIGEGFDLAMRAAPLKDSSLICRKVGSVARHLVAAPAYLARRGEPHTLAELSQHECLVHHSLPLWPLAERPFMPPSRTQSNSLLALHQMALGGAGIALLPHHLCGDALQAGTLCRVLPQLAIPDNPFYFVYPSREYLAPALVALMEWVQQRLPFARPYS